MDTHLLTARRYSGSESLVGGRYRYTAPIRPASARYLVAAFNGGFKMTDAEGGYYTEGRMIDPLRRGAAFVIYADGSVDVGPLLAAGPTRPCPETCPEIGDSDLR